MGSKFVVYEVVPSNSRKYSDGSIGFSGVNDPRAVGYFAVRVSVPEGPDALERAKEKALLLLGDPTSGPVAGILEVGPWFITEVKWVCSYDEP